MDNLVPQPSFSLLDIVDEGTELSAAPTAGSYGAPGGQGRLLTTVALKDGVGRMPLVDPAEWDFVDLVVRFEALDGPNQDPGTLRAYSRRIGCWEYQRRATVAALAQLPFQLFPIEPCL